MSRPTLEVADIVRAAGNRFWEHHGSHLAWQHRKVLDAIVRCRTAALGGHRDQCVRCGHQAISYNSCRNRHCPRCQGNARSRWLAERRAELLPVSYFHIVFTLPHELSALALQNKRLLYDLRSEEHTSELQSRLHLVCRLLLEKKKKGKSIITWPFTGQSEDSRTIDEIITLTPQPLKIRTVLQHGPAGPSHRVLPNQICTLIRA